MYLQACLLHPSRPLPCQQGQEGRGCGSGSNITDVLPGLQTVLWPVPAGMLAAPESPTYLANKGRRDEAVAVATKLWGRSGASQLGAGGRALFAVALLLWRWW
jgi:hypothetical protein